MKCAFRATLLFLECEKFALDLAESWPTGSYPRGGDVWLELTVPVEFVSDRSTQPFSNVNGLAFGFLLDQSLLSYQ